MPNIVAARPVAGQPIETAWGQAVHDLIEATPLIQAGKATVVLSGAGSGTVAVTFPIPFATPPTVCVTFEGGSIFLGYTTTVTATTFNAGLRHYDGTAQTGSYVAGWIAVGTAVGG